jgi:hypothetical protein
MPVISVHESEVIDPGKDIPDGHCCLYIRRDVFSNGSYKEYSYTGPEAEVVAMAERCKDVDMLTVDPLLRDGLSFDEALKKLGR